MENKPNKTTIISSLFWKLMERGGTQGIQLLVQIILARLLSPEEFGMIALVLVFVNYAQVFIQSGFNTALIQKKNVDEVDFSSVFHLSFGFAGILYLLIYFVAPYISNFYEAGDLTLILRVLAINLFAGAFLSLQNAVVARNLEFKLLFKSSLGAVLISGVLGILAAYQGLGIWSLVIQQITNQFSMMLILFFTVKWRPTLHFSFKKVQTLFSFGWKLLVSSLLETLYLDLRTLIIGRLYTPAILGFYNRGEQFPKTIVNNLNGSIQSVMLPTLSAHQEDRARVRTMVRRSIKTGSLIIFPMMVGMAVVARPLVILVLGEQWLPAVPFLQIFCIIYSFMPLHTANLQAVNALGRSDLFLKLELFKKAFELSILLVTIPLGVYAIAIGQIFSGLLASFINAYPSKFLLNYSYKEQLIDIFPSLFISLGMGGVIAFISFLNFSLIQTLLMQIVCGIFVYILLTSLFKIESYAYLLTILKELLSARKRAQ